MKKNYLEPNNFTLVLFKDNSENSQEILRVQTHSRWRFTNKLNSLPKNFNAYLNVSYIKPEWFDIVPNNWGDYQTKRDLIHMFKAFLWEEAPDYD